MSGECSAMAHNVTLTGLIQAQLDARKQINTMAINEVQLCTHIETVNQGLECLAILSMTCKLNYLSVEKFFIKERKNIKE
jgi:hypothetical protein